MQVTIFAENGVDSITAPPAVIVEQLRILGALGPFEQLVAALDALTATKGEGSTEARKAAEAGYKVAVYDCRQVLCIKPVLQSPAGPRPSPKKVVSCTGCGAGVVWLSTEKGRAMPCDEGSVVDGDTVFDFSRHKSHFSTCSKAGQFRKEKPKQFTKPDGVTAEQQAQLFDPK